MYENEDDRKIQDVAANKLRLHLMTLGVRQVGFKPTPTKCHYDFVMEINGSSDTVVEVRGINYPSSKVEEWGHLLIDNVKLAGLKELFYEDRRWTKKIVFIIYCKTDEVMYVTSMQRILGCWEHVKEANQSMMKGDHGNVQHDKKGYLIPIDYMDKIK